MMNQQSPRSKGILPAALVASALFCVGLFIMIGLKSISNNERVVSVRGLAERDIPADLVTWPLLFKTSSNDLKALYAEVKRANGVITKFLTDNGIAAADISAGIPNLDDRSISVYNHSNDKVDRYTITTTILVKTKQVDLVRKLMVRVDELLEQGVPIVRQDYGDADIRYEYTGLNQIKPSMIEEATKNARKAAEQFAKDSDCQVGDIKSASQGYFEISDRDPLSPHIKRVRVVTSVNYLLK